MGPMAVVRTDVCTECGPLSTRATTIAATGAASPRGRPCSPCRTQSRSLSRLTESSDRSAFERPRRWRCSTFSTSSTRRSPRVATLLRRDLMYVFEQLAVLKDTVAVELGGSPKPDLDTEFEFLSAINVGSVSGHIDRWLLPGQPTREERLRRSGPRQTGLGPGGISTPDRLLAVGARARYPCLRVRHPAWAASAVPSPVAEGSAGAPLGAGMSVAARTVMRESDDEEVAHDD